MQIDKPFIFKRNRVWRVYSGGKLIDVLRNEENPVDASFPEDWIASVVKAYNPDRQIEKEGISTAVFNDREFFFDELCNTCPEELFGKNHIASFGASPGFLTKILDSAIRLPVQAHPDNSVARKLYNSRYGKTETWIILGTRTINDEEPYVYLGFNEKLNKDFFVQEALNGEMKDSLAMLHKHYVKPGDVLVIKGGTPHAIGPGLFLIEIMEPTDLVTQPEEYCGKQKLSQGDRFGEIEPEKAMEVFHYDSCIKETAWSGASVNPMLIEKSQTAEFYMLLDRESIRYFGAKKLVLKGNYHFKNIEKCCSAGIVCSGTPEISMDNKTVLKLNSGDTFFMPACIEECAFSDTGEIVFALPPVS